MGDRVDESISVFVFSDANAAVFGNDQVLALGQFGENLCLAIRSADT